MTTGLSLLLTKGALRWVSAIVLSAIATVLNFWIQSLTGGRVPFLLYFPAIIAVGFLAGAGPGTVTLALSALAVANFWMAPIGKFWLVESATDIVSLVVFTSAAGAALAISVLARHLVIESGHAQETVRRSQTQLRTITDALPVLISYLDTEHRYLFNNAAYERWYGKPLSEITGRHIRDLVGQDVYAGVRANIERALRGETIHVETRISDRDAATRDVAITYIPQWSDGDVAGVIALIEDISARKQADQRKDEFLATLAHELRNPMAPIRYAAATLRSGIPERTLQHAREVIERQAAQMSRLLDDLLDMSRITRNVIELKRTPLDVRDLVREATEMAQPTLTNLQHRLIVSTPPNALWVNGDATRLLQVIGNLLDNAAKYTEPGGQIEITLENEAGYALIRVSDSGIGLSPAMLPRVFDLFAQLHKSLKGAKGGLGIGLTVVKRLVELHGGTIEVRSEGLNRGAQFTVRLPLDPGSAKQTAARPDVGRVVALFEAQPRVLIVDDNRDAAETLAVLMRTLGFPVSVAFDGDSALTAFDSVSPALVLLDMGLPDLNGTEVARRIRSRPNGGSVQIVAVTGWGQELDRERTRAAGVDVHLVKPVDPDHLLEILSRRLGQRTHSDEVAHDGHNTSL